MRRTSRRTAKGKTPQGRHSKTQEDDNELPEIYREMLAEAEARDNQSKENNRPGKRRKVGERTATFVDLESTNQRTETLEDQNNDSRQLQTAYDSGASSDDELDIEWEDIDLPQTPLDSAGLPSSRAGDQSLQITFGLGNNEKKNITPRQKPLSAAEKKLRLDTHKTHLLCLLRHVHLRNLWCNDSELQVGFNLPRVLS